MPSPRGNERKAFESPGSRRTPRLGTYAEGDLQLIRVSVRLLSCLPTEVRTAHTRHEISWTHTVPGLARTHVHPQQVRGCARAGTTHHDHGHSLSIESLCCENTGPPETFCTAYRDCRWGFALARATHTSLAVDFSPVRYPHRGAGPTGRAGTARRGISSQQKGFQQ